MVHGALGACIIFSTRAAQGDVLLDADHERQGRGGRSRRYPRGLLVPVLQDRAARPDLCILRATENEVTGGSMGIGRSGAHHGRRVTGLPPIPK